MNFRASSPKCSKLYEHISSAFSALGDSSRRRDPRDFSRAGPLSPELLTTLLIYMVADGNRRGYQRLLEAFWDEARVLNLPLPTDLPVAASSFCTARHKITSTLLKDVLQEIASSKLGCDAVEEHRWHGRKVFGIDGAKVNLQRDPDLKAWFGSPTGGHCPQALLSVLYDLGAKMPLDLEVSPYATSERDHLVEMLPSLEVGDVLVMDRGYPSHEVFQELHEQGVDFLARVPSSHTFRAVDQLVADGQNDAVLSFEPPDDAPGYWKTLKLRVLRINSADGEEIYFITTLPSSEFDRDHIAELYHWRWRLEEFFKLVEGNYIGQGQFRSKSISGVVQEIHALVLFLAITRLCIATTAQAERCDPNSLSQKAAILAVASYLTRVLLPCNQEIVLPELQALLRRIARAREKPRPGRRYPRVSFKPTSRWGPTGRRGA